MGERLKLHVSFLPLLCQLVPGSFMITSSSPSLYIFSSHIKAHVLKLCSLDSVFPFMQAFLCLCDTDLPHITLLGGIWRDLCKQVVLWDQSAFFFLFFLLIGPVAFAPRSPWVITDWDPATRLGTACSILPDSCFVLTIAGARQDFTPVWSHWRTLSFGSQGGVPVGIGPLWRWA